MESGLDLDANLFMLDLLKRTNAGALRPGEADRLIRGFFLGRGPGPHGKIPSRHVPEHLR